MPPTGNGGTVAVEVSGMTDPQVPTEDADLRARALARLNKKRWLRHGPPKIRHRIHDLAHDATLPSSCCLACVAACWIAAEGQSPVAVTAIWSPSPSAAKAMIVQTAACVYCPPFSRMPGT